MTAVVTLLVNDPVTREQRNTTVAVLGKGSSFGVSQYFCYLRKCPVNIMDQAHRFTIHACLSASISFNIVRVSFSVFGAGMIQQGLSIFSILQELALLHHKTRSATVLCKDEVSLLAVCREVRSMVVSNVFVSPPWRTASIYLKVGILSCRIFEISLWAMRTEENQNTLDF